MSIPQPIKPVAFLKLEKALQDELVTESGFKLFLAAEYNAEWNATVTGKILALPDKVPPHLEHTRSQLKVGDEVCFSYSVVSDRQFQSGGALFEQVSTDNPHYTEFRNGKGEKIRLMAIKGGIITTKWVGTHHDKYGYFSGDGKEGTKAEVENWASRFPMGKNQKMTFRNFYETGNHEWWQVGLQNIFAKKVKGELVAIGDRVICKPIEIPISKQALELNGIVMPNSKVSARLCDRAKVVSAGKEVGLKKGDTAAFQDKYRELYHFFGKEYFLIKTNRILGKYTNK